MPKSSIFASPKRKDSYPDRDLDCQLALEEIFHAVVEEAEDAGWSEREVCDALIELAHNHWLAVDAKDTMFEDAVGVILRKPKAPPLH